MVHHVLRLSLPILRVRVEESSVSWDISDYENIPKSHEQAVLES